MATNTNTNQQKTQAPLNQMLYQGLVNPQQGTTNNNGGTPPPQEGNLLQATLQNIGGEGANSKKSGGSAQSTPEGLGLLVSQILGPLTSMYGNFVQGTDKQYQSAINNMVPQMNQALAGASPQVAAAYKATEPNLAASLTGENQSESAAAVAQPELTELVNQLGNAVNASKLAQYEYENAKTTGSQPTSGGVTNQTLQSILSGLSGASTGN